MMKIRLSDRSLLLRLGVLMAMILLLSLAAMLSSVIIAETTQGVATAVNQSGSLRMQSFRIATGLASLEMPQGRGYPHQAEVLIAEFEQRFYSPRLTDAIPEEPDHKLRLAYQQIAEQWRDEIGPLVRLQAGNTGQGNYLVQVDDFVARIDYLVRLLEEYAEGKIEMLRLIQAVCLTLIAIAVMISLYLVYRRLLEPLRELLSCAESARHGDFSVRTRYVSNDELGRLGQGFNAMAEDLSKMYTDLEERVRHKTEDLARRNHSLELLYTTSRQVNDIMVTEESMTRVIRDIEEKLGLGPGTICLRLDGHEESGHRFVTTRKAGKANADYCWQQGCRACRVGASEQVEFQLPDGSSCRMMALPIHEAGQQFGVLLIDLMPGHTLETWQRQVLETVAGNVGTAINNHFRTQEIRRLALHEERGVIARELHDSLAQSLSYLKIQISRLDTCLGEEADITNARMVLAELREGVTSAYRQLRELLTTFRLKMDGRGLNKALIDTVEEFSHRSTARITLDNHLPASVLSPNEEIHVLQIVREALSNVVRHAQATQARVSLGSDGDWIEVCVEDDGRGVSEGEHRIQHYGTTIMKERAQSLRGELRIEPRSGTGTCVCLRFHKPEQHTTLELNHA
jgi:two-component system nitrate/nitrite sensor histidine kinase NarX